MASFDAGAIASQVTEGFLKLPLAQKILFPLVFVGSISGIVFVSRWANKPDYAVLYSDLDQTDAASVVAQLRDQKVAYEIRNDGRSVAVSPASLVPELRMTLAAEGLPKGNTVGLEIFDKVSLGTTTFQEVIQRQRAIQGELERTISSLAAVQSARVHIVQPEKSVFAKRSNEASASVMLKLRGAIPLEKKQVRGIAHLVSSSVEGLGITNVTIVDVYGNLLHPFPEGEEGMGTGGENTRVQYQSEVEKGYAQRIEQMLSRVLGPNQVVARVSAEMDFSSSEREEESYDPGGQVIRSERAVLEGAATNVRGGVPGVVSNLSNDPALLAPNSGATNSNNRSETLKNYEVSRAITKSSLPRGRLTKLSVAVLVDGQYSVPPGAAEGTPPVYKALDRDTLSRIEGIVKSAVGFDVTRGDSVTVENIQFHVPDETMAAVLEKDATFNKIMSSLYYAGPVVFIVLFFVVLIRPLVRFLTTPTESEVDLQRLLPTGIQELEQEIEAERGKVKLPELTSAVDMDQLEELMADNSRVVKENPQQAALLIRYWLNDGRI